MSDKKVVGIRQHASASSDRDLHEHIVHEMIKGDERSAQFLQAWIDGVDLIGTAHFRVRSESAQSATDKNDLRPDFEIMKTTMQGLSGGQRRFLIAMCQFFSDSGTIDLCSQLSIDMPSMADLALLDDRHRSVLLRLLDSYTGW